MAEQVRDGLWLLDLGLFPPFATNGYLVDDGEVTLVDPGLPWNRPSLRSELADAGYGPGDLDRVLLTHFDLDHSGGLGHLLPEFDGPVYLGADDAAMVRGETDPSSRHHKGVFHRLVRRLYPVPGGIDLVDVADGDEVGGFTAFHTPGHNPGHVVYVHDGSVAFLGDLVWETDGRLRPPFWLDSYDMRQVRESIRELATRSPAFDVAAVAHGDPITSEGRRALADCSARI
ncbi:MAG: MBL fold metallo-hydrolase [Haloarculaceae archaeon]